MTDAREHVMRIRRNPPGLRVGVDEEMIRTLVHGFYARVREDERLGPVFSAVIGDDWDAHLDKMCDFWSSVLLLTARYSGKPMVKHIGIAGIDRALFLHWLDLFRATARELCPPEAAELFIHRAERIADSLAMGIAFARGEIPRPLSEA